MTFKQILAQFNPVQTKNDLNDLLAMIERNFGVFSPDMELDIKAVISSADVTDYFSRIIHEAHPKLEYDKPNATKGKKKKELSAEEIQRKKEKKKKRKEQKKQSGVTLELTMPQDMVKPTTKVQTRAKWDLPNYVLRRLVKNGRDYSKKTVASQVREIQLSEHEKWLADRVHFISVPMGGQNKKH